MLVQAALHFRQFIRSFPYLRVSLLLNLETVQFFLGFGGQVPHIAGSVAEVLSILSCAETA